VGVCRLVASAEADRVLEIAEELVEGGESLGRASGAEGAAEVDARSL
jgi:hypothetical protein